MMSVAVQLIRGRSIFMDLDDPRVRRVFFDVHSGLPREGPGNRDCTARALALARPLPEWPRVLDVACGPGMQTMDLAALLPDAGIVAVDSHAPFLAEVQRRAVDGGAADRVATVLGDMAALPFPADSFDLVWCEGAAYIMGLAQALRAWRPLLSPRGRLALTEAVWLRPDTPEAVRRCWSADYPGMGDVESCRRLVRKCGYALRGDFVLPESAWWEDYYAPMQARLTQLAPRYAGDAVAEVVLSACREEIETYQKFAGYYGYVFLVMSVGVS
jgi:ubiquinone/menaquinone biosynthesis C-methylase UbiE